MAVSHSVPKGTVLSEKYKVVRELGRGGMAAVYEAKNVIIGKRVAIKLLAGHLATSQTVVERFLREARAVSKIKSPHICDVFDSGRLEDGTPFLVMELLEGESLYDAMCRDRQMSPELTLAIILQVCRGLAKAHEQQIVHRDLKPENIFLTVDDDGELLVKVLDFGLAKFYDPVETKGAKGKHARLTREGAVFGTPAYMSPEQVRGQAAADTRADLWALACITYECFTGTTVWSTEDGVAMTFAQIATAPLPDPRAYRPDLPESFTKWYKTALDRDINKRYQTVREFADALAASFSYNTSGLDAGLVTQITHQATTSPESDSVTQRYAMRRDPVETPITHDSAPTIQMAPPSEPKRGSASPSPVELHPTPSLPVEAPRSRAGAKIFGIMLVAAIVAAGVVMLRGPAPAEPIEAQKFGASAMELTHIEPPDNSGFKYVANHPWLPVVREAQALVAQGEYDSALSTLRRVYDQHRHAMVANLMEQVQVALVARQNNAKCQVNGLARPRRQDLLTQGAKPAEASPPTIVRGLEGALMTWTEQQDSKQIALAVPLDDSLRNRTPPVDITPEGSRVRTPTLLPVAERFLAVYWDASSGVYLRWIGPDGVIAGAPIAAVDKRAGAYFAQAARGAEGGFIVTWTDQVEADSVDLYYRRFDEAGKPLDEAVRVTDFVNRGAARTQVRSPVVVDQGGKLHFAYEVLIGSVREVRYMAVPRDTKAPGLAPDQGPRKPRTLADEMLLTGPGETAALPAMACTEDGCYIVWTLSPRNGAGVAFVEAKSGKRQWHKTFSAKGKYPTLAVAPSGDVQVVWVEGGKVTTATLGPSLLGPESQIAKVVGDHPPLAVAPGAKRGEWYVSMVDYEAGHREPYALRMQCE